MQIGGEEMAREVEVPILNRRISQPLFLLEFLICRNDFGCVIVG